MVVDSTPALVDITSLSTVPHPQGIRGELCTSILPALVGSVLDVAKALPSLQKVSRMDTADPSWVSRGKKSGELGEPG